LEVVRPPDVVAAVATKLALRPTSAKTRGPLETKAKLMTS